MVLEICYPAFCGIRLVRSQFLRQIFGGGFTAPIYFLIFKFEFSPSYLFAIPGPRVTVWFSPGKRYCT